MFTSSLRVPLDFIDGDSCNRILTYLVYSSWGRTFGMFLMLLISLSDFPLRYSIILLSTLRISRSPFPAGILKLDVVPRFSGWVPVFIDPPVVVVVVAVFPVPMPWFGVTGVIMLVFRREFLTFSVVARLHGAVESCVTLSGCHVVDVELIYLVHACVCCCVNKRAAGTPPVSEYFSLPNFLVYPSLLVPWHLAGCGSRSYFLLFCQKVCWR